MYNLNKKLALFAGGILLATVPILTGCSNKPLKVDIEAYKLAPYEYEVKEMKVTHVKQDGKQGIFFERTFENGTQVIEKDWGMNKTIDGIHWFYESDGKIVKEEFDHKANGILDLRHIYEYPGEGVIVKKIDMGADGTVESLWIETMENGKRKTYWDHKPFGAPDIVNHYSTRNFKNGYVIQIETDDDMDRVIDQVRTEEVTIKGNKKTTKIYTNGKLDLKKTETTLVELTF